jgi:NAD(P)-dependent dehydrogenase (short-subunit alcohol dehydrogenase family)
MSSMPTDLQGKNFLITGANTGIGRATAVDLARRGGRVYLACRSEEKTKPVLEEVADAGPAGTFLHLDLGDLDSVRACAAEFLGRDDPLHVLINNAGLAGQRGLTTSGFELAFGVNHVGHFLLTNLLLERLKASAPARIVNVSSVGHYQAKGIDYDAVRKPTRNITGLPEYAVSKLANVLHAQELARRLEGTGVTTYSLHPGAIASDVWRRIPWPVDAIMKLFMKSTEEGAQTSLYCAADRGLASVSGRYYDNCAEKEPSKVATPELGAELWNKSEEWTT